MPPQRDNGLHGLNRFRALASPGKSGVDEPRRHSHRGSGNQSRPRRHPRYKEVQVRDLIARRQPGLLVEFARCRSTARIRSYRPAGVAG